MDDSRFESVSETAGQIEIVLNTTSKDPYTPISERLNLSIAKTGKKSRLHFKEPSSDEIQEVIEIMESVKERLEQIEQSEEGEEEFDIDMMESGVSTSQRNSLQTVKQAIEELGEVEKIGSDKCETVEVEKLLKHLEEDGWEREKIENIVERLKRDGELFEPEEGKISRI